MKGEREVGEMRSEGIGHTVKADAIRRASVAKKIEGQHQKAIFCTCLNIKCGLYVSFYDDVFRLLQKTRTYRAGRPQWSLILDQRDNNHT